MNLQKAQLKIKTGSILVLKIWTFTYKIKKQLKTSQDMKNIACLQNGHGFVKSGLFVALQTKIVGVRVWIKVQTYKAQTVQIP